MGKPDKVKYFREKAHRMGLDTLKNIFDVNPEWKAQQPFNEKGLKQRLVQSNPVYAAMISSMDENLGKVIAELKRLGLYDNTIIVFTSDNGGLATAESSPTTNKPLKGGKGFLYEGGIREPLIAKWTGHIPENKTSETIVSTVDYFPTLLDLAGITLPKQLTIDGFSIKPALQGKAQNREPIYWHYPHYPNQGGRPGGAIRQGDYKLIEFYDTGEKELYNLKKDIGETNNLIKKEPKQAKELAEKLNNWRKSVKAKMPKANPTFSKSFLN
jgi:arylsulfatase A-like enzyme